MLLIWQTVEWKFISVHVCVCMCVRMLAEAHSVRIHESPALFMNTHSEMCHLAWLNWMMLNLYALLEYLRRGRIAGGRETDGWWSEDGEGPMDSEQAEEVYMYVYTGEGAGLRSFLTYPPHRSTSERGHGYRGGQHRPHLWSQHGKVFSPPSFFWEIYHALTPLLQQRSKICYLHNPDLSHLRPWKHSVRTCVTHWLSCLIIWYFHGFCTAKTKSGGRFQFMFGKPK